MLYICATPIGNLEDITYRAARILREVDIIMAEDTRRTAKLLAHLGIKKPLVSLHEHNERHRSDYVKSLLLEGKNIALVSDAGMPCISDPGREIVRTCVENELEFTVLPGATAFTTALALSNLDSDNFYFEGFLPPKRTQRLKRLSELENMQTTLIFYEAPHRIVRALEDMLQTLGDRQCAVARELTKKFEQVLRVSLKDAAAFFAQHSPKGEFVVVVEGKPAPVKPDIDPTQGFNLVQEVERLIANGRTKKEAITLTAKSAGVPRREVYSAVLDSASSRP